MHAVPAEEGILFFLPFRRITKTQLIFFKDFDYKCILGIGRKLF